MAQKKIKLESIDLDKKISDEDYNKALKDIEYSILQASLKIRNDDIPAMLLFEGRDSAGKSEAIKEFTFFMTEKVVTNHKIEKPTDDEEKFHYLARYWDRIPPKGELGIFDRTWYSRVLVDRVEKRIPQKTWERGYEEINNFEKTLADEGYVIIKFLMHISKKEQLKRFKEREEDPLEQHKLTDEDWKNRKKWNEYTKAYEDMLNKTSFKHAPWHIIESEDRNYSRLKIMKIIADTFKVKIPKYIQDLIDG